MMVLTSIRFMDETPNPSAQTPKDGSRIVLRCSKDDFDIAMAIGDVLIYHTVYCYAHLPQSKVTTNGQGEIVTKKGKMEQLLAALPDTFDRETYRAVSMKHGYPVSTTLAMAAHLKSPPIMLRHRPRPGILHLQTL